MSISAVSNGTNPYTQGLQSGQMSDAFKQRKQDFSALGSALQSGDLAGAQKAFAALQQDTQPIRQGRGSQGADSDGDNDTSKTGQSSQTGQSSASKMKDLMNQLKQALNSGDLQGAQQAYASIQQDMQAKQSQGHHHHHGGQSAAASATSSASVANAGSTTQTINVTA